jgi:hypothetical protein
MFGGLGREREGLSRPTVEKIGEMWFCEADIRGTSARYFSFIDTAWFCKLCLAAHIDSGKLPNYLTCIEKEAVGELCDRFDDPHASLCFPKSEDQPTGRSLFCVGNPSPLEKGPTAKSNRLLSARTGTHNAGKACPSTRT